MLDDDDQQRLGIHLAEFCAESEDSARFGDDAQYFTPLLQENFAFPPALSRSGEATRIRLTTNLYGHVNHRLMNGLLNWKMIIMMAGIIISTTIGGRCDGYIAQLGKAHRENLPLYSVPGCWTVGRGTYTTDTSDLVIQYDAARDTLRLLDVESTDFSSGMCSTCSRHGGRTRSSL